MLKRLLLISLNLIILFNLSSCDSQKHEVIIYTSVDRHISEPIFKYFEKNNHIKVKAVYDTEANKTTGLVNRLIAEKQNPRADVFWNSEIGRTLMLKEQQILSAYNSPNAILRKSNYRDIEQTWTGLAARARVIIVNTDRIQDKNIPNNLVAFTDPKWYGQAAIANPHFGTTGTHFTALYNLWGEKRFNKWLIALQKNKVTILPGNAQVKNKVSSGEYAFGLTDTDDALAAIKEGAPVKIIFPDQNSDGLGTFLIPNSVAIIKNAPHPVAAKQFIDFLLAPQTEELLASGDGGQIPLSPNVKGPDNLPNTQKLQLTQVDYKLLAKNFEIMLKNYRTIWTN
ncbi:MAG: extracellular solute-binding protein [Gammaproteobacteria bacterium]|nr:extracellular solute-binding protein [Gammaproteobacteria bacterium]